jgi:hypothetical protein
MGFIDLDREPAFSFPVTDITIIGAGAAGIMLGLKLAAKGKSVTIIESGHIGEDEERQSLNEVEQTGKLMNNAVWGRKRAVGGTTIAWGGQSLPFTSIDFEKREWIKNSGWPLKFEELEKYYNEANSFMGIDNLNYSSDIFPRIQLKIPAIDPEIFNIHVSKWANQPDFYKKYKNELQGLTVVYNAHTTAIHKEEKKITSLTVKNFNRQSFSVPVNKIIITAGTIESIRLLMTNDLSVPNGWLGKCFMEHPCIEAGDVKVADLYKLQQYFNTHTWNNHRYSVRISLSEKFQRQQQLLNCSASLMFSLPEDCFDPYGELKSFKQDFKLKRLIKISGSVFSIMKSGWAYFFKKFYYKPNAQGTLALMIEQEPLSESYISLSEKADRFGIPEAKINRNISPLTWKTAVAVSENIKKQFADSGLGNVELKEHISYANKDWKDLLSDVCHHMGGCRMSDSPSEGVVNTDLKVWDTDNMYICSCAVFPTSSHSNPTLTMLALGARLVNHLS